jgi:hypothetical protein
MEGGRENAEGAEARVGNWRDGLVQRQCNVSLRR